MKRLTSLFLGCLAVAGCSRLDLHRQERGGSGGELVNDDGSGGSRNSGGSGGRWMGSGGEGMSFGGGGWGGALPSEPCLLPSQISPLKSMIEVSYSDEPLPAALGGALPDAWMFALTEFRFVSKEAGPPFLIDGAMRRISPRHVERFEGEDGAVWEWRASGNELIFRRACTLEEDGEVNNYEVFEYTFDKDVLTLIDQKSVPPAVYTYEYTFER